MIRSALVLIACVMASAAWAIEPPQANSFDSISAWWDVVAFMGPTLLGTSEVPNELLDKSVRDVLAKKGYAPANRPREIARPIEASAGHSLPWEVVDDCPAGDQLLVNVHFEGSGAIYGLMKLDPASPKGIRARLYSNELRSVLLGLDQRLLRQGDFWELRPPAMGFWFIVGVRERWFGIGARKVLLMLLEELPAAAIQSRR